MLPIFKGRNLLMSLIYRGEARNEQGLERSLRVVDTHNNPKSVGGIEEIGYCVSPSPCIAH